MPAAAALEQIEGLCRLWRTRAGRACHLADPAIGALLTQRGYQLTSFENVLGLALTDQPEPVTPPEINVRSSGKDEFESWLDVAAKGFACPDTQGVPSDEQFPREVIARAVRDLSAAAGVMRYVALREGIFARASEADSHGPRQVQTNQRRAWCRNGLNIAHIEIDELFSWAGLDDPRSVRAG